MAYGTPTDPTGGTVITVAYAVANLLDPIRWLRLLTGNADPPGSNYVVVSTSTTGTSWQKVPADALASGAVVAHLGYTPANKAGDTFTGTVNISGAASDLSVGRDVGIVRHLSVGGQAVVAGALSAASAAIAGAFTPGSYGGGSTAAGTPSFLGISVGANGAAISGPVNPGSYIGGSTSAGTPSFKGVLIGNDGLVSDGPIDVGGQITGTSLRIGSVSNASVPSGLVAMVRTAAEIATGWSRETNLDGRVPVGAGTTFSTTFVENTAYGSSWSHGHTDNGHVHSGADLGVSGNSAASGAVNGTAPGGGNSSDPGHTHGAGSLDVSGNTSSGVADIAATAWAIPSRAYVFVRKS